MSQGNMGLLEYIAELEKQWDARLDALKSFVEGADT